MANRRSLTEGIKPPAPPVDSQLEKDFVYQNKSPPAPAQKPSPLAQNVSRMPISTRVRSDFASALKRASLERQLNGVSPNTLQDMLEAALEPWLKSNGYLE
jgi:cell pole-organizing protein PopZ